jgi:hypothetical protein
MNASPRKRIWGRIQWRSAFLLGFVALCTGCSRTVVGGYEDSPDRKYRIYGRLFGAYGRAFTENTEKTILIRICTTGQSEQLLLSKEYRVKGSDVTWQPTWGTNSDLTVVVFDYGLGVSRYDERPKGSPSNHICTLKFRFDSKARTFTENQ